MTTPRPGLRILALAVAAVLPGLRAPAQETKAVSVEPTDLRKRPDLVGREVVVDDRVSRFQYHKETGFDQIFLTRAPDVSFEVPPRLRPEHNPTVVAVKIRGVLRREGGRWWVDVNGFEPQPADLDRLNRAVAFLPKTDWKARKAWTGWAEQRAKAFQDAPLFKRAREVEADAIRAESDDRARAPGAAGHWLALADRARAQKVPEPEPSAQAHRGFRAALSGAESAEDLNALAGKIETFFPDAPKVPAESADPGRWEKPYLNAPADAYRSAPPEVRKALDHRLWADALQRALERRAAETPKAFSAVAEEAARRLPDRPGVAQRVLEKGLASAASEVGALRLTEVETLARLYRDALHQPARARELYLAWLNDQKDRRLSPRDAEGRIALAEQYENLLDDRATAVALLRQAWSLDPESREVTDAFRRRGFRKVKGEWVEGARAAATDAAPAPAGPRPDPDPVAVAVAPRADAPSPPPSARSDSLRGSTPEEVRARMGGRPNRRLWVASQGQVVEQWIYFGPRLNQYVNILHRKGDPQPRVISYYSLPRSPGDPLSSP